MTGNILTEAVNADLPSAVQAMINRSCLIDFGVVQKVVGKGLVFVAVSVANSKTDVRYMTCTLVNIAGSDFTIDITPKKGDKVLVFYPRRYSSKMFRKEKEDAYIDEDANGYNLMCGLALLCNQYRTDTHKNLITFEDGGFTYNLVYNEDEDKNKVIVSINTDGELHYASNENFSFDVDKDGAVNIEQNNVKIDINKNSEITIDNSKATIKIDSSGNVSIDAKGGKISLKNNLTSLKTILSGMLQILNTSLVTAGSPASHTVVPSQFTQQTTQLNQLMD